MNEEKQAERLARWLESPGDVDDLDADLGLDADVVEAITALRPDLAPGPRLTADDILASLTEGPLAGPARGSALAEAPIETPEPANRPLAAGRRWWRAVGGVGGLGVLLAAAASLLLVVRGEHAASPVASPAAPVAQEAAAPPARGDAVATTADPGGAPDLQGAVSRGPGAAGGAPPAAEAPMATPDSLTEAKGTVAAREPLPPAVRDGSEVLDDAVADADLPEAAADQKSDLAKAEASAKPGDASLKQAEAPPLVAEAPAEQAERPPAEDQEIGGLVAGASAPGAGEGAGPSANTWGYAAPVADEAEGSLQSPGKEKRPAKKAAPARGAPAAAGSSADDGYYQYDAAPAPPPPPPSPSQAAPAPAGRSEAWAAGLDAVTLSRFDAARARAQQLAGAGDLAGAAAAVAAVVTPPARAGQYHAALAARYWMAAGQPERAAAVCRDGLALSSEATPERQALLALLASLGAAQ